MTNKVYREKLNRLKEKPSEKKASFGQLKGYRFTL